MKRQIISIDEKLCTGCGVCVPDCPEGALQIIDNKARLVSDLHCDGLGACIGNCPHGAITQIVREAEPYSEKEVIKNIVPQGTNTIIAHLDHLLNHGEMRLYGQALAALKGLGVAIPLGFTAEGKVPENLVVDPQALNFSVCREGGCGDDTLGNDATPISPHPVQGQREHPASAPRTTNGPATVAEEAHSGIALNNWPIKINLTPVRSAQFDNRSLLIAADCVAGSQPDFSTTILPDHTLLMGCPKFDDTAHYIEKLAEIFRQNAITQISVARMEVPCCGGLRGIVDQALRLAQKTELPVLETIYPITLRK